jgi:hypothetical protein
MLVLASLKICEVNAEMLVLWPVASLLSPMRMRIAYQE